jgi:uncharacterized YigZ family protein
MSTHHTLAATATVRQEIKKSRFMAIAAPVNDEEAAKAFVASHTDPAANHNCWAWRIGQGYRFNDDGEPSGTAGKPILQAIDGQGLDRVIVVVTRWFGGVLLGSGGLVRAYGGTAALCLRSADKIPIVDTVMAVVTCPFGDLALLQARLNALPDMQMNRPTFNDSGAEWTVAVPRGQADEAARLVPNLTGGRAALRFEE